MAFENGPVVYTAKESILVFDHAEVFPAKPLHTAQEVVVAGTYTKDGVVYGRPTVAVKNGWWYGVPMDNLVEEEELYNTKVDLFEKQALHRELSFDETITVFAARQVARIEKVRTLFTKNKKGA